MCTLHACSEIFKLDRFDLTATSSTTITSTSECEVYDSEMMKSFALALYLTVIKTESEFSDVTVVFETVHDTFSRFNYNGKSTVKSQKSKVFSLSGTFMQ